jgi:6-phosphogluconolactonase (cycloisomerase 2 family)
MALHPSGQRLYALNGVSTYQGLPCGSVQTFSVDEKNGQLASLGSQPLSLSATMPRQLTLSPDGKWLAVAVSGGGSYNLLPVLADGQAGRPCGILKETGCGLVPRHQDKAHPEAVLFDKTGNRIITADLGSDRICVLSIEEGLTKLEQYETTAGVGPRHLALHPAGHLLYVANALEDSLLSRSYNATAGQIGTRRSYLRGGFRDALAIHPDGEFLFTAGSGEVSSWRIESTTGGLCKIQSHDVTSYGKGKVFAITVMPDGSGITALTDHAILGMQVNKISGRISQPSPVVPVFGARSITILNSHNNSV